MYTNKKKENISKNIIALKKKYKEKQIDVAEAVDIPESTYSEYINLKREPTKENISKLAKHYHVSEDSLVDTDLTIIYENNSMYDILNKIFNNTKILFPIIEIECIDDPVFLKAKDLHNKLLLLHDNSIKIADVIRLYFDSYEKYNNHDSRANILMLLLIEKSNMLIDNDVDLFADMYDIFDKHELELIIKDAFLKRFDEDFDKSDFNIDNQLLLDRIDTLMNNFFNDLVKIDIYREFLEYYLMLQYLLGIGNTDLSLETNGLIAGELIRNLTLLNNRYINSLLDEMDKILKFD